MPSTVRTFASALIGAAAVSAHGYVESFVINGAQYSGYIVTQFPYQSDPPVVAGWATDAKDLGFVGRDIFATTASKAADKARPSQQQLDQVDQEAPSKQWVGADGKTLGPNETPDLQFKAADGSQVRYNPKDAPGNAQ